MQVGMQGEGELQGIVLHVYAGGLLTRSDSDTACVTAYPSLAYRWRCRCGPLDYYPSRCKHDCFVKVVEELRRRYRDEWREKRMVQECEHILPSNSVVNIICHRIIQNPKST